MLRALVVGAVVAFAMPAHAVIFSTSAREAESFYIDDVLWFFDFGASFGDTGDGVPIFGDFGFAVKGDSIIWADLLFRDFDTGETFLFQKYEPPLRSAWSVSGGTGTFEMWFDDVLVTIILNGMFEDDGTPREAAGGLVGRHFVTAEALIMPVPASLPLLVSGLALLWLRPAGARWQPCRRACWSRYPASASG